LFFCSDRISDFGLYKIKVLNLIRCNRHFLSLCVVFRLGGTLLFCSVFWLVNLFLLISVWVLCFINRHEWVSGIDWVSGVNRLSGVVWIDGIYWIDDKLMSSLARCAKSNKAELCDSCRSLSSIESDKRIRIVELPRFPSDEL